MSSILAGCHYAREMIEIEEIECPKCHKQDGMEMFVKDNITVGDSICDACGYTIDDGTRVGNKVKQ